jgi:adenine-specific DNA methylase
MFLEPSGLCLFETQCPVSELSKESFKERKAVAGQTLTGLGKWWGRKPLILCRAALLGLLLPASNEPDRDRDVFLGLLTLDPEGLRRRKTETIPTEVIFKVLDENEKRRWFNDASTRLRADLDSAEKAEIEALAFERLSYDDKLTYCCRPEHLDGPSQEAWQAINAHLGTEAANLPELVAELGRRRLGRVPRVGDSFCGGGSIAFEASRLGFIPVASDLNPVACLLTWSALHLLDGPAVARCVCEAQEEVFAAVDREVTAWGIEHDDQGRRADAWLYCVETRCPQCGWLVPLSPTWVIANRTRTAAVLSPNAAGRRFDIGIHSHLNEATFKAARAVKGTVRDSRMICPRCRKQTPLRALRADTAGSYGLRLWSNDDVVPRPDDIYQERLYCVRRLMATKDGKVEREYAAPGPGDVEREQLVLAMLRREMADWQSRGYLPSRRIEPGKKTDEPIRTRGWTHWHHLFHPRQLLVNGLFAREVLRTDHVESAACLLLLGRLVNWNSRLCRWLPTQGGGIGGGKDTFSNQALNPLYNYGVRGFTGLDSCRIKLWGKQSRLSQARRAGEGGDIPRLPVGLGRDKNACLPVRLADGRAVRWTCDFWITDPPYADAVCYHEVSEFFLAWYERGLSQLFPHWSSDSQRSLAVQGEGEDFRLALAECYRNLARHMPENGVQIVLFTHQNAAVWADLVLILWAAQLRVTAAWCIQTETDAVGIKEGQHVQGTVLLVLRRQQAAAQLSCAALMTQIESEVSHQLDAMLTVAPNDQPNFRASDYQLAGYAAALRLLTTAPLAGIDVEQELRQPRTPRVISAVEQLIRTAVACAEKRSPGAR